MQFVIRVVRPALLYYKLYYTTSPLGLVALSSNANYNNIYKSTYTISNAFSSIANIGKSTIALRISFLYVA